VRARLVIALVTVFFVALAGVAGGQETPRRPRKGGLHVSGGGVVGYVGGSGSISGNVTGPGGGGSTGTQPVVDDGPSAVEGGVVSDVPIPPVDRDSRPASSKETSSPLVVLLWALAVLVAGAAIRLYRRRPLAS
jgi:MYXO-CTERM domain-containing protein